MEGGKGLDGAVADVMSVREESHCEVNLGNEGMGQ